MGLRVWGGVSDLCLMFWVEGQGVVFGAESLRAWCLQGGCGLGFHMSSILWYPI